MNRQEERNYAIALAAAEGSPLACAKCSGTGLVPSSGVFKFGGWKRWGKQRAYAPLRIGVTFCEVCNGAGSKEA